MYGNGFSERHPDADPGAMVPERCILCFDEFAVGETVITRSLQTNQFKVDAGQQGQIDSVLVGPDDGALYVVRFTGGQQLVLPRIGLAKLAFSKLV